jgi:hypothetical protein
MVGIGSQVYFPRSSSQLTFMNSVHREASQPRRESEVLDYYMRRRSTLCL